MTNEHLDFENFSRENIKSLTQRTSSELSGLPGGHFFDRPPNESVRFEMKVDGTWLKDSKLEKLESVSISSI